MKNLVGKKFGHLTVESYDPGFTTQTKADGRIMRKGGWVCRCTGGGPACQGTRTVLAVVLNDGRATSCGCRSPNTVKDLSGKVFGNLTVLSRADNTAGGKACWLCLCVCQERRVVRADKLLAGLQVSCGCGRGAKHSSDKVLT